MNYTNETSSLLSFDKAAPQLLTKANIQSFADKFIESVNDGYHNPLESAAIISGLEAALKVIKEGIRETVISELKEGGKGNFRGVKIESMEVGGRYDYSQCGDNVYNSIKERSDILTAELKAREDFLKHLPKEGIPGLDLETGEMMTIYPPAKPASTTTYKITIPK